MSPKANLIHDLRNSLRSFNAEEQINNQMKMVQINTNNTLIQFFPAKVVRLNSVYENSKV